MNEYRIDELFDLQMGKTPSRNNLAYWNSKDYKWISIADITRSDKYIKETKEYLSELAVKDTKINIIPANTVVMSFKLSIGKTAITSEPMYSNEAIMSFIDKHLIELIPDYIYYLFSAKKWEINANRAVKGKTLNKASLSNVVIKIHNIDKQQKIVAKLDNLNLAIDKCKRLLELHDELIKSKFYEMFGDPLLNPMNWEVKKLQDISKIGSSKRIYQEELSTEAGIPFLRIFDILNKMNGLPIKINFYVPEENYNNLKLAGLVPKPNDVLVTSRGTLGKCYIVQKNDCFYFQDGMITWLSNFEKHMLPQYIYYLFQMPGFRTQIDTIEAGSTVAFLSISKIKNLKIILPPILFQTQFAQYVETVESSKTKIKELQSRIEYLKASYMQEYFA